MYARAKFPVLSIPVGRPTIGFGHSEEPKELIRSSSGPFLFQPTLMFQKEQTQSDAFIHHFCTKMSRRNQYSRPSTHINPRPSPRPPPPRPPPSPLAFGFSSHSSVTGPSRQPASAQT